MYIMKFNKHTEETSQQSIPIANAERDVQTGITTVYLEELPGGNVYYFTLTQKELEIIRSATMV